MVYSPELERDPFDASVVDPAECGALDSSLWEIKVSVFSSFLSQFSE